MKPRKRHSRKPLRRPVKLQVYNQYNRMKVIDVDKDGKLSDEEKANAVRRQREAGLHGGQGRPNQRPHAKDSAEYSKETSGEPTRRSQ